MAQVKQSGTCDTEVNLEDSQSGQTGHWMQNVCKDGKHQLKSRFPEVEGNPSLSPAQFDLSEDEQDESQKPTVSKHK